MRYYRRLLDMKEKWLHDTFMEEFTDLVDKDRYYLMVTSYNVDEGPGGFSEAYLRDTYNLYKLTRHV